MLTIVRGSTPTIAVNLQRKYCGDTVVPADLTGATVLAIYRLANNTVVEITATIVSAAQGRITFALTEAQTEALGLGILNFDIKVTIAGVIEIWKFVSQLSVVDQLGT